MHVVDLANRLKVGQQRLAVNAKSVKARISAQESRIPPVAGVGHIPLALARTVDDAVQDLFTVTIWGRPTSAPMPSPRAKAEPDAKAKPIP